MSGTLLIASAAYVDAELEAEFGRLPPAFLPLGSRRLFVHQAEIVRAAGARVLISLPEDFAPDAVDLDLLAALGIGVVPVPGGLSLGQSIVYVINVTASSGGAFAVLHGDTLLHGLDFSVADAVSVDAAGPAGYRWGQAPVGVAGAFPVLTGFFSFSAASRLVQAVTRCGGDFVAGLADYAADPGLTQVVAAEWLDFGHANTYHGSRRRVTTEREFNRLSNAGRAMVKTGSNAAKIEAEARWFEALPAPLRLHAPAYLGRGAGDGVSYALEYLHHPTLADLFVFGRLERATWEKILTGCDEFLSACAAYPAPAGVAGDGLYLDKTLHRLEVFAQASGVDLSAPCRLGDAVLPSLIEMARIAAGQVAPVAAAQLCLMHGDFCFSNILYEARGGLVRVIDPRGIDAAGVFTSFGDIRYDIAKLYHSAVGQYDLILAGYFSLVRHGALHFDLELQPGRWRGAVAAAFLERRFGGLTAAEAGAPAICVLLFLSMLPLHGDDARRQAALLANAMRLFAELER